MLRTFLPAVFLLLILSCERIPLEEYAVPAYDGQLTWTEVTSHADWSKRYDHAALAFHDSLWIFGGYNPGQVRGDTYYEDVWKSADGENWVLVTDSAPWQGRRGHRAVTFDDGSGPAMFIIGGFAVNESTGYRHYTNDIWKSTDGLHWEEIKPATDPELTDSSDWSPRMYHACLTANHGGTDYIYIIGGRTQIEDHNSRYASVYFNDVWRSANVREWEKLPNNDYGIRAEHAAVVDPGTGRIYLQGGNHGILFDSEGQETHPLPDWHYLWYSDDGISWSPVLDTTADVESYLWRGAHNLVFYADRLWGMPGKTTSTMHYHFALEQYYTIWTYTESDIWEIDSRGGVMDPRHSYATVLFDNKIWFLGGFTDNTAQDNDVWTAQY